MDAAVPLNAALSGRYDIEREVGAGGMATVYLARDVKHNRRVALKVLRPDLGAVLGSERFLSEIQVTANLQHPNLLPLFDSGEAHGLLFYVMPYVEGESLRARLDRDKQLSIDDALHIAVSVASALDYAHRHGVIHRDLKPENILLHEGQPLVADFGIALAVSNAGGGRITQTGLSLGTPQYMSPEQATGDRVITAASDVYSLAAVTYEMLTGEPPHVGATSQAIIARVLTETPRSVRATRPLVPDHVDAAIARGLEKIPADRFATAREFADALSGRVMLTSRATSAGASAAPRAWWRYGQAQIVVAALALACAAAMIAGVHREHPSLAPEIRFTVPTTTSAQPAGVSISPDGRYIAYVGNRPDGNASVLWLRPLASSVAQPLPGTDGAVSPFWSPDSRSIGFWLPSSAKLAKLDISGGQAVNLADVRPSVAGTFAGGAWNGNGVIVYSDGAELYRVAASGGVPTKLTTLHREAGEVGARYPSFLPDQRHVLFLLRHGDAPKSGLYSTTIDGETPAFIAAAESKPVYDPSGFLLFQRNGAVFAQPFDGSRRALTGTPAPVAEDVLYNPNTGLAGFAISNTGILVVRNGGATASIVRLAWYRRDGKPLGTVGDSGAFGQMNLSPDDRRVTLDHNPTNVTVGGRGSDIWTMELSNGILTRLTSDTAGANGPIWFPDSRTVVFQSLRRTVLNFYKQVVGAGTDTPVLESSENPKYLEDVSRDGRWLLYHRTNTLVVLPLSDGGKPIVLGDTTSGKDEARFSPDGRWVSYGSRETGAWEVYVASFPSFEDRRRLSPNGGRQARWRADGTELFYLTPSGQVMMVSITQGATPAATTFEVPVALFQSPLANPTGNLDQFSVARDGQRFLFLAPLHANEPSEPLTVMVNWQAQIKR